MHHHREDKAQPLVFRTLRGQLIAVRQAIAQDDILLIDLLARLSERARHLRYMRRRHFSADVIASEAARMTQANGLDRLTLVATLESRIYDEAVAVAELVRGPRDLSAGEIALLVRDDAQRQGIGSFLFLQLIDMARRSGITSLNADMLAENRAMLRLIHALGLPYAATTRHGETRIQIALAEQAKWSSHTLAA